VPTETVAYFSMEIALRDDIPTFSGGLGVLAGDYLRSAADLGVPAIGVTLLYHRGFFRQEIDAAGRQVEHDVHWSPADLLERLDTRVEVPIGNRSVAVGVWRYVVSGEGGSTVPVYLLDTKLHVNDPADQTITDQLYAGDPTLRLSQEAVLGLAGPRLLAELGHEQISTFHLNEGHASLVPVALLSGRLGGRLADASAADIEEVRRHCVFTTHTPVPAGHDRFTPQVTARILGRPMGDALRAIGCLEDDRTLNMTILGMFFSQFVNGVTQRHGEVARAMFPRYRIDSITNGVHVPTWVAPSTAWLLDRHAPNWRRDNTMLHYATGIPLDEVQAAHAEAKRALLKEVARRRSKALDPAVLTLGVARRAAAYKRNDLLLSRPDELRALVDRVGPLQVLYSGKAHPRDKLGKALIERVNVAAEQLADVVDVVYLEDYGMRLAALLVAGVDVWVNTPVAPHEASGTSGMKAALNGVPSLSILDGWWLEGHVEGVTGWAVGADQGAEGAVPIGDAAVDSADAAELHRVLADVVAPLYYVRPDEFAAVRRSSIALNGSYFTTQRMVTEYVSRAYGLPR